MSSFGEAIDEALGRELVPLGFTCTHPRRWARTVKTPVHEIFHFQPLKGATYSARWGYSLDFVPLFRGSGFRWKRTARSADFDLCIDPLDLSGKPRQGHSLTNLPGYLVSNPMEISQAAAATTQAAIQDFDRVQSIADVVEIFRERASMYFVRFWPENYIQTHFALGLALIATGDAEKGDAHLALFCKRHGVSTDDRFLRKARAEAISHAASSSEASR